MIDPAVTGFINHLLRGAAWARETLRPFVGRTARFEMAPFVLTLSVLDSGHVAPAASDARPDVTVRLTPGLLLRLGARDESAWREVEVVGDTELASAINHVVRNLQWDLEEDMSRVLGDVAAHRLAVTGRAFQRWGEQAAENTARSFAEYWTEEQPLIARRRDVEHFNRAVDELRDDLARLEQRLDRLADSAPIPR